MIGFLIVTNIKGNDEISSSIKNDSVISPSPTVAALCKYGQQPVDYSTGIPNISIPLYTLKCGEIELPITLSYHAGGIKVDEAASWVGLGWSLNSGGVIGVNVNGSPDDFSSMKFLSDLYQIPSYEQLSNPEKTWFGYEYNFRTNINSYMNPIDDLVKHDWEPDVFTYNVLGHSGQFVYDFQEGKFYNTKGEKDFMIKLKTCYRDAYDFEAYDYMGIYYLFDKVERINHNMSAWNLSKIIHPNHQDSLLFSYQKSYEINLEQHAGSAIYGGEWDDEARWNYGRINTTTAPGNYIGTPDTIAKTPTGHCAQLPSQITASNGMYVIFQTSKNREDIRGEALRLDKIIVMNADDEVMKQWSFEYTYFQSYVVNIDDVTTSKRLKLVSLNELDSNGNTIAQYDFEYYSDNPGDPQMPYRYSFAGKDLWGYCNGQPTLNDCKNFRKEYPNFKDFSFSRVRLSKYKGSKENGIYETKIRQEQKVSYDKGSNRNADKSPQYTQIYSLKKIKYPTGGYTEYIYEPNEFSYCDNLTSVEGIGTDVTVYGAGLRIKEIIDNDGKMDNRRNYEYFCGYIPYQPKFINRNICQTTFLSDALAQGGSMEQKQQYQRWYSGQVVTYLEMFPTQVNQSSIGNSNPLYAAVFEHSEKGSTLYEYSDFGDKRSGVYNEYETYVFQKCFGLKYIFFNPMIQKIDKGMIVTYDNNDCQETSDEKFNSYYGWFGTYFNRGQLLYKTVYDSNENIISETEYKYQTKINGNDNGIHRIPAISFTPLPGSPYLYLSYFAGEYIDNRREDCLYNFHWYAVGLSQLSSEKTTRYFNSKQLTIKTEYDYNSDGLDSIVTQTFPDGHHLISKTIYSGDINKGVYLQMQTRNMRAYPVEQTKSTASGVISSTLMTYKDGYPKDIYQFTPQRPVASYTYYDGSNVQPFYGLPKVTMNYENGRLKNMTDISGLLTQYTWDSNKDYVIEESKSNGDLLQVRKFEFQSGIGMTSKTAPNGYRIDYQYDPAGRLKQTSDSQGILQKFKYNYSNK